MKPVAVVSGIVLLMSMLPVGAAFEEPAADFWVDADYAIRFSTLSNLTVEATLLVHKAKVDGRTYTADEIRDSYQGIPKYPGLQSLRDNFKAELVDAVRDSFRDGLASIFPDALTRDVTETTLVSTLESASDSDPYNPAIQFTVKAEVENDREKLGLGTLSGNSVQAVFAAGARLFMDTALAADPGFNNTFSLHPPFDLAFRPAPGATGVEVDGSTARATLGNWQGTTLDARTYPLFLLDPEADAPPRERVESDVDLDLTDFDLSGGEIPVTINVESRVHAFALAERAPGTLPSAIEFDAINSDGLRALYATGAIGEAELAVAEQALLAQLKQALTGSLGTSPDITGGFDRASLTAAYGEPFSGDNPLRFTATATTGFAMEGVSGEHADTAFEIGAAVGFDLLLVAEKGHTVTYVLGLPADLAASPGDTFALDNGEGTATKEETVAVKLHSANAPVATGKDARLLITVDLADVDISAAKAAGGDFGEILVNVDVDGQLGVIEVPPEFKDELPAGVEVEYLTSDAIRLLLQRGLIDQATFDELEAQLLSTMRERISQMVGQDVDVRGGFDDATLAASLVGSPLSGEKPIVFKAGANLRMPLAGGPPTSGAAIALYSMPLSFNLPKIEDLDTTYKFILPRGLALEGMPQAEGGETATGTEDGRDYFTVTPGEDVAVTSFSVAVTPTFVAMKFWPILLGALFVVALVVLLPVFLVMRRRRRRRGGGDGGE